MLQVGTTGSTTLNALVSLYGLETGNGLTFANLISQSGANTIAGGISLFGPGRIEIQAGCLEINDPQNAVIEAITAIDTANDPSTNHYGATSPAYNLLFDIASGAHATVNGSILLGNGGLSKLGDGDLTLNSLSNSYSGPTQVLGGYLQVNGSVPATASCSNGGDSNLCDSQDSLLALAEWDLDNQDFADEELGLDSSDPDQDSDFDAMDSLEDSSYDMETGEGMMTAPGLEMDLAVNDSFAIADYDDTAEPEAGSAASGSQGTSASTSPDAGAREAAVMSLSSQQVSEALNSSDHQATQSALQNLAPELFAGGIPATPTPQQLQADMQSQVLRIRSGGAGLSPGLQSRHDADQSGWIASSNPVAVGAVLPTFERSTYQPAVVHLRFSEERPSASSAQGKD